MESNEISNALVEFVHQSDEDAVATLGSSSCCTCSCCCSAVSSTSVEE